ncbi:MAG: hypothetical protein DRQ24_04230 [Candidatus Latescibacterota bacterium]|nr:MAG: hypothetical protein DRQ24_04230 [Candidatus Latescibacterota bacterium]
MNKVLVISYYWPPAGGPGVQRVLSFVKYLPQFGWQPVVLTVKNGEYTYWDTTLAQKVPDNVRVYRAMIVEPYDLYRRFTRKQRKARIPVAVLTRQQISLREKIAHFARANFFVPDARVGWIPFALKEALKIVQAEKIDLIFTSSPPHTVQLIGMRLMEKSGLPWVADFRDPWTEIRYYCGVKRFTTTVKVDSLLEKRVLSRANRVIAASPSIADSFREKVSSGHFCVITNGFDEEDFSDINPIRHPQKFRITYVGNMGATQNPEVLFRTLVALVRGDSRFCSAFDLLFVGNVESSVVSTMRRFRLDHLAQIVPYVPHTEALMYMIKSAILLLVIPRTTNNKVIPGKLFEYLRTGRPILCIGPTDGDAAEIIKETGAGSVVDYEDVEGCEKVVVRYYKLWKCGKLSPMANFREVEKYERRNLTKRLGSIFSQVLHHENWDDIGQRISL